MRRFLVLGLLLTACGHEAAPGESVGEVCNAANEGEQVQVSGYLVPPFITLGCTDTCTMYLSSDKSEREGAITLPFEVGTGPRTMDAIEMPGSSVTAGQLERLSADDFVIRDDSGERVSPGDTVRVGGQLSAVERDGKLDCRIVPASVRAL